MSSSTVYGQRRSWRQQTGSGGNRWTARILFTLIALTLVALFLYIVFRPRPSRELRTFLIQAGSFDNDVIMPPMYAATAQQRIIGQLGASQLSGRAEAIRQQFSETANVKQSLDDPDDTVLLVVRGYLLSDADDQPAIAGSDLGIGQSPSQPAGLLPLSEILQPLASEAPESFSGARLVVLDVEPLAALPRFDQYGDRALESLKATLEQLQGPHADRVWVLVTRGPLQNPGWDPDDHLPISTQTLLEALAGAADLNEDTEVHLDELCRYISARYRRLAQRSKFDPPEMTLLRGGTGRVAESREARDVWIARVEPVEEAEVDESEDADQTPDSDEENGEGEEVASSGSRVAGISMVRFRAGQAESDDAADSNDDSQGQAEDGDETSTTDSADTDPDSGGAEAEKPAADQSVADQSVAGRSQNAASFWDMRDQLEAMAMTDQLQPLGVSPHLWRKLIQVLTHAEVEALDPAADASRTGLAEIAARDLNTLRRVVDSQNDGLDVGEEEISRELVEQLFLRWKKEISRRRSRPPDQQVRVADQLQQIIALGRVRIWSQLQYHEQAIICGGKFLGDSSEFLETLNRSEGLLANQQGESVDLREMRGAITELRAAIQASDSMIAAHISELINEFGRTDEGNVWSVIRQAHAWLRSPLPTGNQRRDLMAVVSQTAIERVDRETLGAQPDSIALADPKPDRARSAMVSQIRSGVNALNQSETLARLASQGAEEWARLAAPLGDPRAEFAERFAAALRIDPRDIEIQASSDPVLHQVAAKPRLRNPSVELVDSSDRRMDGQVTMQSFGDHLWVRLDPDSDQEMKFQLTARLAGDSGSVFDEPPLAISWREGTGVRATSEPEKVELTIPPRAAGQVRLDLRASTFADVGLEDVPIEMEIALIQPSADPVLATKLKQGIKTRIALPQRDRIRVAVRTLGLSRESISGEENLPGGVWLRTFASRNTRFTCSLFNDADRNCRTRVWLVRLRHPLTNERVAAYWPDLVAARTENLRRQLMDDDGRVFETILSSDRTLKGPADLELEAGRLRTKLAWQAKEPAAGAAPPSEPAEGDSATAADGRIDISHGMALVVRLIDGSGKALPGGDQIVWMIPKPWSPESYVNVQGPRYRGGEVQVTAEIRSTIDGDNLPDEIPEIDRTAVAVRWTEDDQWASFQAGSTSEPLGQPLELSPGGLPGQIKVLVPKNRGETVVRLDVDGWPRAIRRVISHFEDAEGRRPTRWETIQFASIAMDYGQESPALAPDDDPISATTIFHPNQVVFRGRGKSLQTRIHADLSEQLYRNTRPPEIRLLEGDQPRQKFWTDRLIRTVADKLADNGRMDLVTTVDDLSESWTTEATRSDDRLDIQAQLTVGQRTKTASIQLTLDSTPPRVDRLSPGRLGPYYVGEPLVWEVGVSDVERNERKLVSSGVRRIVIGVDADEDGKPDDAKPMQISDNSMQSSLTPEQAGIFRVAAQVWDGAGLASKPLSRSVAVVEKPKPSDAGSSSAGVKRGRITGRIAVRSGMRGKLTLSPAPEDIQPGATISVESSRSPTFNFTNVPEGDYTLTFRGFFSGASRTYIWKGLKIGETSQSLSLRDAETE